MTAPGSIEYRIARLHEHLAEGAAGELGLRIEAGGTRVTVIGSVPTARCRAELMETVRRELADLTVHFDLVVTEASVPTGQEELP
ncbi:hypothetical protein [Streptomyces xanthii]|uniref:BON domain-containing protein n=1 Tax=Streptomyces xanthii TaxID=2768069 RepID=A0A7H1B2A9_9ACTN|nr:hypothetical protein [Streptomyces xanthii]QNS02864.1 hypothetical protein IAG42_03980 [Streptomyces xanthii]